MAASRIGTVRAVVSLLLAAAILAPGTFACAAPPHNDSLESVGQVSPSAPWWSADSEIFPAPRAAEFAATDAEFPWLTQRSGLARNRAGDPARLRLTQNDSSSTEEADIANPGPDMGDYPNSAYTLRKGQAYVEMGPASFRTKNASTSSAYATPFLLRYGVTDDVEFRVLGTGLTSLISPNQTTGFGVLTFDTKIHLWNDRMEYFIPAVSFEASLQSRLGSPAFQAGIDPSLNINMDFPFTEQTNLEATVSYAGGESSIYLITGGGGPADRHPTVVNVSQNYFTFSVQAALEQEVTDTFSVFVHGYYGVPVQASGGSDAVAGAGFFYQINRRVMTFGSANAGLTETVSPFLTQLGVAIAF